MPPAANLRHLYAVTEIARRGSVSAAADSVHLSQSALTQALGRLETQAGQPLFERTGAGMVPTEAGALFISRVEQAFDWLRAYEREIAQKPSTSPKGRLPRMTAAQLRALVAVVETGGFSLAARKLGLAQPSVYRAAKSLEALCGEPIFRRTHRGVEPSVRAKRLARFASLAFSEIRQAFEEVDELQGRMQSQIRVGCLPLARVQILPDAVNRFLEEYPGARISVVDGPYDELLQALRHGHIDLLIGALRHPAPTSDIRQETLFHDPLAIVVRAGHPILKCPAPGAMELAGLHWIAPRAGTPARDQFSAFFSGEGIESPAHVIECSSLVATRGLVLGSDRAALLSARQVHLEVASGQLAFALNPLPGTERPIGLTLRRDWRPTPILQAFLSCVREAAVEPVEASV